MPLLGPPYIPMPCAPAHAQLLSLALSTLTHLRSAASPQSFSGYGA